jgi:hypothetical protein
MIMPLHFFHTFSVASDEPFPFRHQVPRCPHHRQKDTLLLVVVVERLKM